MNICFFNLTEPAGEKVGNGVVRVAATLAVVLRERGHRVEFYAAPPKSTLTKLGVSAGTHFRNFLRERKIDVAVWQMGSCRVPFSLKNLPCRLIAVWHNAPNFRNEDYALRLCEKYKIRAVRCVGFFFRALREARFGASTKFTVPARSITHADAATDSFCFRKNSFRIFRRRGRFRKKSARLRIRRLTRRRALIFQKRKRSCSTSGGWKTGKSVRIFF